MLLKKQTEVIEKKEGKRIKLLKRIIGTDEKNQHKVENALLYLPKKQIEKYVKIDKKLSLKI